LSHNPCVFVHPSDYDVLFRDFPDLRGECPGLTTDNDEIANGKGLQGAPYFEPVNFAL
jgi:hypothetical protein